MARALAFAREVLSVEPVYSDPDFAMLRHGPSEWMLHADHTYRDHPLHGSLAADDPRGIGAEIRLHDTDPDAAEAAARERGDPILAGAMDKPHGVREVFILDPDGYLWAIDRPAPRGRLTEPTPVRLPARARRTVPHRGRRPQPLAMRPRPAPPLAANPSFRCFTMRLGAVSSVGRAADS